MLYPLLFQPIFKERVWGGRNLERLFGKRLPPTKVIGESWEISDRPGDVSVIRNGPLAGRDLRWLMENHQEELLGAAKDQGNRFPLLVKILDAQDVLSLQVHPPVHKAVELRGEPKTEMWYVAEATPQAVFYAGLKKGTTRAEFESRLRDGTVEQCFHKFEVKKADSLFLPSGRVHALGAGNVIFEIQQNSDTTYRVFDWHRVGLDGKPRELHLEQSLTSINFDDFEPALAERNFVQEGLVQKRVLVHDPLFRAEIVRVDAGREWALPSGRMLIVAPVEGQGNLAAASSTLKLAPGAFSLIPASLEHVRFEAAVRTEMLVVEAGS